MILDKDRAPHLSYFLEFLQSNKEARITLDQWESFLQFNHAVKEDLSNFEDDGACKLYQYCFNAISFDICRAVAY